MAIKGIIWDCDGTVLDTLTDMHISTNVALTAHSLPTRTPDEVRRFMGNGIRKEIERAVPEGTEKDLIDRVEKTFREHYAVHSMDNTAPYPGILAMLTALKEEGMAMALVSNKAEDAVEELFQNFFKDTMVCFLGDIPTRPKKPSPESTLEALQRLGVKPEEALFVGDSEVDMQTARNAHLPCLCAGWGFRGRDFLLKNGASFIADTPEDALRWIRDHR